MKIIRPLKEMQSSVTSNAPDDDVEVWVPEGRDLLEYIDAAVFDVAGNTLVAVSLYGGELYAQDLSTGVARAVGVTVPQALRVLNVSVSPNGAYAYIIAGAGQVVRVQFVELSSGAVKYESLYPVSGGASYGGGFSGGRDGIEWAVDSSAATFIDGPSVRSISTTTWVSHAIFDLRDGYADSLFSSLATYALSSLQTVGGDLFVSGHASARAFGSQPIFDTFIVKLAGSSGDVTGELHERGQWPGYNYIRYNEARDEILCFSDRGVLELNPASMVLAASSAPSPVATNMPHAIKVTSTHLVTRSRSASPYWRYHLLTDYSLDKSLPDLPDPGTGIGIGSAYTVVQQDSGIAVLDNADTPVVQQNPNVIARDTYVFGDHVYRALKNNNDRPDQGALAEPQTWRDLGVINRLRMADGRPRSFTEVDGDLIVDVSSNTLIDGLALFGVYALSVQVQLIEGQSVVFDTGVVSLRDSSEIDGWYSYFNRRRGVKKEYVLTAFPPRRGASMRIILSAREGKARLGQLVFGQTRKLGDLLFGLKAGVISFSQKERNTFGEFDIIKRPGSKRAEYPVSVRTGQVAWLQEMLASLDAVPIACIGNEDRRETIIWGLYRDFEIILEGPVYSDCLIEMEALI